MVETGVKHLTQGKCWKHLEHWARWVHLEPPWKADEAIPGLASAHKLERR